MSLTCACRDGTPCLAHYALLPYERRVEAARRAGVTDSFGSAGSNRSLTGRAERGDLHGHRPRERETAGDG